MWQTVWLKDGDFELWDKLMRLHLTDGVADHNAMPYTAVFQVTTPLIPEMSLLESKLASSQPGLFHSSTSLCSCSLWPTHDAQAAWHSLRALPLPP